MVVLAHSVCQGPRPRGGGPHSRELKGWFLRFAGQSQGCLVPPRGGLRFDYLLPLVRGMSLFRTNVVCYSVWYEGWTYFVPTSFATAFGTRNGYISYKCCPVLAIDRQSLRGAIAHSVCQGPRPRGGDLHSREQKGCFLLIL